MKHLSRNVISRCLVLTLSLGLLAPVASATEHSRPRFVLNREGFTREAIIEASRPLGMFESVGNVKINGQNMAGRGLLWRGDLVQAADSVGTRVTMNGIGTASLLAGSAVRFSTQPAAFQSASESPMLVAALDAGSVLLRLQPGVSAQLKIRTTSFLTSAGASLRFSLRGNEPLVEVESGTVVPLHYWGLTVPAPILMAATRAHRVRSVLQAQTSQPRYVLKPVGGVRGSAVFDVRARATRQIQIQVTDENDRPVPDVPIIISFGSQLGRFSSTTVSSNANGIASVNFSAASQGGQSNFTATIQGTNISLTGQIVVQFAPAFWTWQNAAPVLGTAATMIAVPTVIYVTREENRRVRAVGGPVIKP